MLTAAGHHVVLARSVADAPLDGADLVVADLDVADHGELGALAVPSLGYYSHVEAETRKAALEAGVDTVVPRSRMARELPQLVEKLLSD
jgi:hypothetical protein